MKKILLLGLVLLLSLSVNAQQRGGGNAQQGGSRNPEELKEQRLERMIEQLGFIDKEQEAKFREYLKEEEALEKDRRKYNRKERKANSEEMEKKLKSILTPEQYEEYEEILKKQREMMQQRAGGQNGMGSRPPGGRGGMR